MITLYGFGPGFGLPEHSPYVTKTQVQLKMAGLDYRFETAMPFTAPKGQLPWVDDDGEVVADSTFIRRHIEAKYGVDLDAGLTPAQRAQGWAIERMIENQLGWVSGAFRWLQDDNFKKGPARFFDGAPDPAAMRIDVQGRVREATRANGVGRHSGEDILWLGQRSLAALSTLLGDKPFLFGERPTATDAVAFSMSAGIMTPFFAGDLRAAAESHANLVAYVRRGMALWYPQFAPAEQGWAVAA